MARRPGQRRPWPAFEEMVRRLQDTREWRYVDREVDIRLSRMGGGE